MLNAYFNPRSPCGERLRWPKLARNNIRFQSTLPVWGATGRHMQKSDRMPISIHAPRVGSDLFREEVTARTRSFQSTLPVWGATNRGQHSLKTDKFQSTLPVWGATTRQATTMPAYLFQSTLPVWGATFRQAIRRVFILISIHAPRVGSDQHNNCQGTLLCYFNPRSPCGERLITTNNSAGWFNFNPRSPCGERQRPIK